MWLPRAIAHRRREGRAETVDPTAPQRFITRFTASQRMTHIFVIVSFLLLALTGMSLKFADQGWAVALNAAFGGVAYASLIHRFMAVVTFGYFVFHIAGLILAKRREGVSWLRYIFSPGSMMFNLTDLKEFIATVKWFVGKGIRPDYGRFTYWEKFDYFAVFWGVPVIGFSGLFLWFPEYFSQWLPGWIINVALIIHSDEALLAVGFIFTIHFINTHLRPESFPMDTVIFTGIAPLEKYQAERPREVAELMASGKFHERVSEQGWSGEAEFYVKVIGGFFLACGVALILLIIYSLIGA
jgi:cytochrome b subunit of formate dehydrogenase